MFSDMTVKYCLCDDRSIIALLVLFDDLLRPKTLCIEMYQYWILVLYGRTHDIGS